MRESGDRRPAWRSELSQISPPNLPSKFSRLLYEGGRRRRLAWVGALAAVLVVLAAPVLVIQTPWLTTAGSSAADLSAAAATDAPADPDGSGSGVRVGAAPMGEGGKEQPVPPAHGGTGPTALPPEPEPEQEPVPPAPPAPAPPPATDPKPDPRPDPPPTRTTPPAGWSTTVDNSSSRFSASSNWSTRSLSGQYGSNVCYASPVEASDPAWYRIDIPATGRYRVEVWFPAHKDNNDRTPYIVATSSGNQTIHVNQRTGGSRWVSLGTFTLEAGDTNVVAVSRWRVGGGRVVADAVRVTKL